MKCPHKKTERIADHALAMIQWCIKCGAYRHVKHDEGRPNWKLTHNEEMAKWDK